MARKDGFIKDCQTLITNELQFADAWEGLKQEFLAMQANSVNITQQDLDAAGMTGITPQQFQDALTTMQTVVDFIHTPATAAKLYRIRR